MSFQPNLIPLFNPNTFFFYTDTWFFVYCIEYFYPHAPVQTFILYAPITYAFFMRYLFNYPMQHSAKPQLYIPSL